MNRILPLIVAIAACGKSDAPNRSAATSAAAESAMPAAAPPALAHASQADLAREIDDAEQQGRQRELKRRWQGQHIRWTVMRSAALCSAPDDCNVIAFPDQRPAPHGWMPAVTFAPGQYEALEAACAGQDPCNVTLEGTLSSLEISADLPTRLELSNVRVAASGQTAATGQAATDYN